MTGITTEIHESVTKERVMEMAKRRQYSLDNPGCCIACGADQDGVEGDAEAYTCESCGKDAVYGDLTLLISL